MISQRSEKIAYTIKEVAKLSGLPESTLRYYEKINIIDPIERDTSSRHRIYNDDDLNIITAIACLNATGLSLKEMRAYFANLKLGDMAADQQEKLLIVQKRRLELEAHYLDLRQQYVNLKIEYWRAVKNNNSKAMQEISQQAKLIAGKLKLSKNKLNEV